MSYRDILYTSQLHQSAFFYLHEMPEMDNLIRKRSLFQLMALGVRRPNDVMKDLVAVLPSLGSYTSQRQHGALRCLMIPSNSYQFQSWGNALTI